MSYINTNTLQILEASDIMLAHPDITFPNRGWYDEDIAPFGYAELNFPSEHPFPGFYEKLEETTPAKIGDKWYRQFAVVPMTEKEIKQKNEQIKSDIILNTQSRLDNFAQTRNYDSMLSLCTYATSTNPKFQAEGQYGVEVRDATWEKLYEIMAEVEASTRPMPTGYEEIEAELPTLQWTN